MINTLKPKIRRNSDSADRSRRSFFWTLGAGASGALASAAGLARTEPGDANDSALRVALLQEEKVLRRLHQTFEQAMDDGRYEDVIEMFAGDAQIVFNGGVFDNRSGGASRLYRNHFQPGQSGKRMEPAPGFELDADQRQDSVEVSADRLSANAVFPYSIQVGAPIESDSSLAAMARLHGDGVRKWWEGGVYHLAYRRAVADGRWKISRLEFHTLSRADYRPGRSYASSMSVTPFSARYPEDRHGPDALA